MHRRLQACAARSLRSWRVSADIMLLSGFTKICGWRSRHRNAPGSDDHRRPSRDAAKWRRPRTPPSAAGRTAAGRTLAGHLIGRTRRTPPPLQYEERAGVENIARVAAARNDQKPRHGDETGGIVRGCGLLPRREACSPAGTIAAYRGSNFSSPSSPNRQGSRECCSSRSSQGRRTHQSGGRPVEKSRLCGCRSPRLVRTTSSRADDVPRLTTVVVWDARSYAAGVGIGLSRRGLPDDRCEGRGAGGLVFCVRVCFDDPDACELG